MPNIYASQKKIQESSSWIGGLQVSKKKGRRERRKQTKRDETVNNNSLGYFSLPLTQE
jgi:hypothetical protein